MLREAAAAVRKSCGEGSACKGSTADKRPDQDGQFPYDYVSNILRFGPAVAAHGSSDMPTWGGIFQYMDNYNQAAVQKHIKKFVRLSGDAAGKVETVPHPFQALSNP